MHLLNVRCIHFLIWLYQQFNEIGTVIIPFFAYEETNVKQEDK